MAIKIIAEAGVNHNGSLRLAKQMVDAAAETGVDYIKFQTFVPNKLVSKFARKADYQKKATGSDESQLEMLDKLALTKEDFRELSRYCEKKQIGFISTPFDLESIDFLNSIPMDFWKLPSGEITNLPYLEKIGRTLKPVVMSTGMSTLQEVRDAVAILKKAGTKEITLLHCNTQYPTPMQDVNLRAMQTLEKELELPVGYSDHTKGIEIPVAAVGMHAQVIEKHFTLDRNMEGPDHAASLEPEELKAMVQAVRNVEQALGSGKKEPSPSECCNISVVRKSIVAKCQIQKGEIFTEENLTVKRPANGISPMHWYEVLGTAATRDYAEDEPVE